MPGSLNYLVVDACITFVFQLDLCHVITVEGLGRDGRLHGVKATGEPPLMLAVSVWAAVKHALSFLEPGQSPPLRLPATHEEILRAITALEGRPRV